jgi:addiction module HigA family antidote
MTEYVAKRNPNRCPTHPGALLREAIESVSLNKTEIADALGISRQHLYDLSTEKKGITPNIAVRLGKLFGNGPDVWVRMQLAHDLWHAARTVDTSEIKTIEMADA